MFLQLALVFFYPTFLLRIAGVPEKGFVQASKLSLALLL
jgi:hypothetical protein